MINVKLIVIMKKKVVLAFMLLGSLGLYAQVGIGTELPHGSSVLETASKDKGILIPRITLLSETDITTIKGGNQPESLMVYHKGSKELIPGFYYWEKDKWNASISNSTLYHYLQEKALPHSVTITENNGDYVFTWKEANGQEHQVSISKIIKDLETLTTLTSNNDEDSAKLIFTPERGVKTIIDINKLLQNSTEFVNYIKQLITTEVVIPKEDLTTDGIIVIGDVNSNIQTATKSVFVPTKLSVKNNSITASQVKEKSIQTNKIANGAVSIDKMANDLPNKVLITNDNGILQWEEREAIETPKAMLEVDGRIIIGDENSTVFILNNSVLSHLLLSIQNKSITGLQLADRTITGENMATNTVETINFISHSITLEKFGKGDNNSVISTDAGGYPRWEVKENLILGAKNGLNKTTNNNIELGGSLTNKVIINTSNTNALSLKNLIKADIYRDQLLMINPQTGVLEQSKGVLPHFFYMPPIRVKIVPNAKNQVLDIYNMYKGQYSQPIASSDTASPLPVLNVNELNYIVTYADSSIFTNLRINDNGVLTYDVKSDANPNKPTFLTIVLQVK